VGKTTVTLPGIGSYVALAIQQRNLTAIGYAILTMLLVIITYDQLLFRPVVAWADKFRFEQTASATAPTSWMLNLFRRTRALRALTLPFAALNKVISNLHLAIPGSLKTPVRSGPPSRVVDATWLALVIAGTGIAAWRTYRYLSATLGPSDVFAAVGYGFITLARVVVLIALATLIWVPVGVWIGLRPKLAERIQPLAQFLAAFPANLAFPVFVVIIVRYGLNPNIWLSPLMILGTQWYILFNVIAGAMVIPTDLKEAALIYRFTRFNRWKRLILPACFPYLVTGMLTASGGAWNASILAEYFHFQGKILSTNGLGSTISRASDSGRFDVWLAATLIMAAVALINRLVWRRLYRLATSRFNLQT
jgi:NitT/TauT family transport system permease protein